MKYVEKVLDVYEENDCWGRKTFAVSIQKDDAVIASNFVLSRFPTRPEQLLKLATVAVGDEVVVEMDPYPNALLVDGDFTDICSSTDGRPAICRCGAPLTIHGYHLYCPNSACFLTSAAKVGRLANARLNPTGRTRFVYSAYGNDSFADQEKPFSVLHNNFIWGTPKHGLEDCIRHVNCGQLDPSIFLIESNFKRFLSFIRSPVPYDSDKYAAVRDFFSFMDEIVYRRDYNSIEQNEALCAILGAFAIPSLSDTMIGMLVQREIQFNISDDIFGGYIAMLTSMQELYDIFRLSPLEIWQIHHDAAKVIPALTRLSGAYRLF